MVELEGTDTRRVVCIGSLTIGTQRASVIAGPCSVEPGYVDQAVDIAGTGADALRAGVFKPRTHPDSFQGMGLEALPLLEEARRRTGLPLISEVLSSEDAEALGELADGYQVGSPTRLRIGCDCISAGGTIRALPQVRL